MKLGEVDIARIEFDLRSRDEIPKMLIGFQHIYTTPGLREEVFKLLENLIPERINKNTGRPGMELWQILVMGSLRLNCDWNYDKLQEIVNHHSTIRRMLGVGTMEDHVKFQLSTLKDNVSLLTPAILEQINDMLVKYAHEEIVKKKSSDIKASCDSFVAKTNVHYPTDVNLLNDAMRKVLCLVSELCSRKGIGGWRQGKHLMREIKKELHHVQNVKRKNRKNKDKDRTARRIKSVHRSFINLCEPILSRVTETIAAFGKLKLNKFEQKRMISLKDFAKDAARQIDQIRRRVLNGEAIRPTEKIYSLFERHTEWIVKGKAGVSQELGVKLCIMKDQYGFILNHFVMEKLEDADVAVSFTEDTKKKFTNLKTCSYDKGFYSAANKAALSKILDFVIMPKKGKLNSSEQESENSQEFKSGRKKHSAVEATISALQNHGLDLCPDKKITGFKRYIALAIFSRNVQIVGHLIQQQKLREQLRRDRKNQQFRAAA